MRVGWADAPGLVFLGEPYTLRGYIRAETSEYIGIETSEAPYLGASARRGHHYMLVVCCVLFWLNCVLSAAVDAPAADAPMPSATRSELAGRYQ